MVEMTRRRVLGSAAGIPGASVASMALPPNVRKALAAEPNRPGSFRDIKHVVMLMQENRSFDHYFGTMAGVAGFNDPHAIKQANGRRKAPVTTCCSISSSSRMRRRHRRFIRRP
jgi:phospholipase C